MFSLNLAFDRAELSWSCSCDVTLWSVAVWLVLFSRLTMTSLCHSTRRDCLIVVSNVRNSDFFFY